MTAAISRLALAAALTFIASGALAQDFGLSLGGGSLTGQSMLLIGLVTLLSIAPGLAVMVTCFPFVVTVLSILRQAIGLQQSPPNALIVSLALFLTWFVMEPVFLQAWSEGGAPLVAGAIDLPTAFDNAIAPFRVFMEHRVNPETLSSLASVRGETVDPAGGTPVSLSLLVPSFMLSEISRAFEIGFLVYLPFLVIDLVVSAILMSMGMMMVPPAVVALPFKLAFFVVADGWTLISGALVRSYM
ncbi:flagellar type III secretion system pore protein FliP [Albidovulum sp.]|uniref:flagellar type III secretion system pore protein FliP n=1 Tax=Albidovulum sp. TaxID=1872424 RepID=UPI003527F51A